MTALPTQAEIEALIAQSRGAVAVKLQGAAPQILHLPAATRRVLIDVDPAAANNIIEGVEVGTMPPAPGYEVTLESHKTHWNATTGVIELPATEDVSLTILPWPHSSAPASAQIRLTDKQNPSNPVKGGKLPGEPLAAMLVYQDGFWVLGERPD